MSIQQVEGYGEGSFDEMIKGSDLRLQELAKTLRNLIEGIYPKIIEVVWPKLKMAGYGVGPKKKSEQFCYIGLYSKHVTFGFYRGAELQDPLKLLTGTAKQLRYIKIESLDQIFDPAIKSILKNSLVNIQNSLKV